MNAVSENFGMTILPQNFNYCYNDAMTAMILKTFYRQPLFLLIVSSLLFGVGAIFVVFIDLDAVAIAFYRLFCGAVLFGGILLVRREPLRIAPKTLLYASASGVFLGVDLSFWNESIVIIGPGIATILNSLQVFFMALFGIVYYRDKQNIVLSLSLFVTFIGVILLCSPEIKSVQGGLVGVIAGILSGLTFAFSMLSLREAAKRQTHSLVNTMFYSSLAGALVTGIYGALTGTRFMTSDLPSWGMIVAYGTVVHVLAWFLMAKSMPYVAVAVVGLVMCLEPLTVLVIDVALLGKNMTLWQAIGALLTLSAVYLGSQSAKGEKHDKSSQ